MPSSSFSQDLEGSSSPPTATMQSSLPEPVPTLKPADLLATPPAGPGEGRRVPLAVSTKVFTKQAEGRSPPPEKLHTLPPTKGEPAEEGDLPGPLQLCRWGAHSGRGAFSGHTAPAQAGGSLGRASGCWPGVLGVEFLLRNDLFAAGSTEA